MCAYVYIRVYLYKPRWYSQARTYAIWPMLMIYVVIGAVHFWWRCHYVTHDYNDKQYIENLRL